MNIALFLQMAADACPDRRALTSGDVQLTYKDLFSSAKKAAVLFAESGCAYVSVLDESSPAAPIALMGAAMAGIPYVPLNYRLSADHLHELRQRIDPAFLIAADESAVLDGAPMGKVMSRSGFLAKLAGESEVDPSFADDPVAVAVQLFTSGTTGTPKAAILRHEHLVSYVLSSVEFMSADEKEATLVAVPPYHIAGVSGLISSIYACRRVVQLPAFHPEDWLNLVENEQITNAFVVPTMLSRILEEADSRDTGQFSTLSSLAYGGGRMPTVVVRKALETFPGVNFTNAYGLTETSSTITLLGPDEHREALSAPSPEAAARLGSVGRPLPQVEIEIRDGKGEALGPLERGEVFVRGPQVSGEYLGQENLSADGWFQTHDAGYLDQEGYLYLAGRTDDVIIRGGENIAPAEIEDVLLSHRQVRDVAAFGAASDEWGEAVAVVLVMQPGASMTEEEVKEHVRVHLRSSRVPEQVHFAESLPYNEMGKLLRRVLREEYS